MILSKYGSKHEIVDRADGILDITGDYIYTTVNIPCMVEVKGAFCHVHCVEGCKVKLREDGIDNVIKIKKGTQVLIGEHTFFADTDGHFMAYENNLRKCVRNGNEWVCLGELVQDYGDFKLYLAYRQGKEKKVYERNNRFYDFISVETTYDDFKLQISEQTESYEDMCLRIRREGQLGAIEFRRITGCCYDGVLRFMTRWGKSREEKVDIHESIILLSQETEIIKRLIGEESFETIKQKYLLAVRGNLR